ncbi:CD209 antigen-like protein B isoform X1 [Sebastes umbrosus]|uniref:CD209 antigen-like protein B isoform X1 n=2 Tax=Sebastes umbrosus TaxID=72105 RepID=UPI00189F75A7|nr:CD209 antigen-like protein B isoform X1 [Sebastes umbrosus]
MSVIMNKKSGEGGEDSVHLMAPSSSSRYGWRAQISGMIRGSLWWIGAAVVFFLLILILGVVAHNSSAIGQRDLKSESLIHSLMMDRDTMRDERDQLKTNSRNLTKEMNELHSQNNGLHSRYTELQGQNNGLQSRYTELQGQNNGLQSRYTELQNQNNGLQSRYTELQGQNNGLQSRYTELQSQNNGLQDRYTELQSQNNGLQSENKELQSQNSMLQSQYNATAESRDQLQKEVNRLTVNVTGKTCFEGWKPFGDKCYFFSANGVTKTWESSRKDCKERGADLAIITSHEELNFVSKLYGVTWIGLSDRAQENKWKWVDGTDLVGDGYWQDGEPNNSDGNEDCAEVSRSAKRFNDVPCERKFSWACEV